MLMNHFLSKKANVKYHPWIWFLVDSGDYILIGSKIIDDFWYCGRIKISVSILNYIKKFHDFFMSISYIKKKLFYLIYSLI